MSPFLNHSKSATEKVSKKQCHKWTTTGALSSSPYFSSFTTTRRSPRYSASSTALVASAVAVASASPSPSSSLKIGAFVTPPLRSTHRREILSSASVFEDPAISRSPTGSQQQQRAKSKGKTMSTTKTAQITTSFEPIWSGCFDDLTDVPVHTLILGTHPSIKSLEEQQYFGRPMNTFWWIAGDCLGFRRASGISPSTGKPYAMTQHLRHGADKILSYVEQQRTLVRHGFALWDIVRACRRPGSLDQHIFDEVPNDLCGFAQQHRHSLKRIVFANGTTGCNIFKRHFEEWLGSGELQALPGHDSSEKMFASKIAREEEHRCNSGRRDIDKVNLIVALGVSPAAARFTYLEKRNFWEAYVYQPGLKDFGIV